MRIILALALLLGVHALAQTTPAPASASTASTALGALKLVPADQAANLVSIFAREGVPAPDRWYIVTFDPATENGVHEFVVVGNRLVASRQLSQFAESLKPLDVLGSKSLKFDSDAAGQLALDYGRANSVAVDKINYELKRDGAEPFWKLVCFNQSGSRLGELKISAEKGSVIAHEGFAAEPPPAGAAQAVTKELAAADAQALASTGTANAPLSTGTLAGNPKASPKPSPKKQDLPPKGLGGKLKQYFFGHHSP